MSRLAHQLAAACLLLCSAAAPLPAEPGASDAPEPAIVTKNTLKVVTLNIAHGRKTGVNQMLQSGATARRNLDEVANLLKRVDADMVALQEADAPSRWSGGFDHVATVADAAGYPYRMHGLHARNKLFTFGTALLSRYPFEMAVSHSFEPSPPTLTKGFDVGGIDWNPGGALSAPVRVHVVSVHLDFSRRKVREAQVAEMDEVLGELEGPLIILGDFNADAGKADSVVRSVADRFELTLFEPMATNQGTYRSGKRRLDWILVSKELRFVNHTVWPDIVSDHRAVAAEVVLVEH